MASEFVARICPGNGIVVCHDALAAVIGGEPAAAAELIEQVKGLAAPGVPASDLLRFAENCPEGTTLAVALLNVEPDVVMVGDVTVQAGGESGTSQSWQGGRPRIVALPRGTVTIELTLSSASTSPDEATSLERGVAHGAGLLLEMERSVVPPPPPPDPAPDPAPKRPNTAAAPVNLLFADESQPEEPRSPLPQHSEVITHPEPESEEAPFVVHVEGLACSLNHLNRPSATYCSSCGRRLQDTIAIRRGPRPSLGTLIFESLVVSLDRDYVVGRAPDHHDRVVSGHAAPLRLDDDERRISRVHAEVRLDGWDVFVVDRGSANGTYVRESNSSGWVLLVPDDPRQLRDGNEVAIGQHVFAFQERR